MLIWNFSQHAPTIPSASTTSLSAAGRGMTDNSWSILLASQSISPGLLSIFRRRRSCPRALASFWSRRERGGEEREGEREEDRERRDKLMTSCHAANEINPDVCFLAHEQTHLIYYFETVKRVIWPILKEKVCKSFSFQVGDDFSDFDDKFKG